MLLPAAWLKKDFQNTGMTLNRLVSGLLFPCRTVNPQALRQALNQRTILITGASYGIGEALTCALADMPVHLLLVARTEEKLVQIQESLSSRRATCQIFVADLSDAPSRQMFIDALRAQAPSVDIVVNNAGKSICRPLMHSLDRLHDAERTMRLNYFAPVHLCLSLLHGPAPTLRHIINVSAANVLLAPAPYWAAYQASKTAFDQWLRCAEPELRVNGVHVTTVYFPLVDTRMITPTYDKTRVPVLPVSKAANVLCWALLTQKSSLQPWWLGAGQLCSVLFNGLWRRLCIAWLEHKRHA